MEDRSQYSQWQLCLMDNVTSWTLLTLMLSGVFLVLFAMEAFLPQRLYLAETPPSIRQAFANAQFRRSNPLLPTCWKTTASSTSTDWPKHDFTSRPSLGNHRPTFSAKIQGRVVVYGWVFMVILWVSVYFFSVRPFRPY